MTYQHQIATIKAEALKIKYENDIIDLERNKLKLKMENGELVSGISQLRNNIDESNAQYQNAKDKTNSIIMKLEIISQALSGLDLPHKNKEALSQIINWIKGSASDINIINSQSISGGKDISNHLDSIIIKNPDDQELTRRKAIIPDYYATRIDDVIFRKTKETLKEYGFKLSYTQLYDKDTEPDWLVKVKTSTVLYYDDHNKDIATQLAALFDNQTGIKFEVRKGMAVNRIKGKEQQYIVIQFIKN